jgi:type 1 glutamine amidotransferase
MISHNYYPNKFMKKVNIFFLISFTLFFVPFSSLSTQTISNTKKSVLFVYGGWDGHKPKEFKDLFLPWLEGQGFNVTLSNSLDVYADKEKMKSYDLIFQTWTMGELTKEQESGLIEAVKNGTGLAGCHGGLGDSFRGNTNYLFMVGGQFVAHPGGQIKYKVNINNLDNPITKGLSDFSVTSEQYYMLVDPGVEVLASTTFSGEYSSWVKNVKMPVIWQKKFGKGKVFYSSVGHSISDFEVYEVMEIMKRGILWAVRD